MTNPWYTIIGFKANQFLIGRNSDGLGEIFAVESFVESPADLPDWPNDYSSIEGPFESLESAAAALVADAIKKDPNLRAIIGPDRDRVPCTGAKCPNPVDVIESITWTAGSRGGTEFFYRCNVCYAALEAQHVRGESVL